MPDATVLVTSPPRPTAPANSKMPAMMTACHSFSVLDPTDVANEFATSLAPMPHAMKHAERPPQTTIHSFEGTDLGVYARIIAVGWHMALTLGKPFPTPRSVCKAACCRRACVCATPTCGTRVSALPYVPQRA
eukprot:362664-Chlamydomonas_euryale.AAC.3